MVRMVPRCRGGHRTGSGALERALSSCGPAEGPTATRRVAGCRRARPGARRAYMLLQASGRTGYRPPGVVRFGLRHAHVAPFTRGPQFAQRVSNAVVPTVRDRWQPALHLDIGAARRDTGVPAGGERRQHRSRAAVDLLGSIAAAHVGHLLYARCQPDDRAERRRRAEPHRRPGKNQGAERDEVQPGLWRATRPPEKRMQLTVGGLGRAEADDRLRGARGRERRGPRSCRGSHHHRGVVEQHDAPDQGRLEASGSAMVGTVTVHQRKVWAPRSWSRVIGGLDGGRRFWKRC
jgi:hypothetical protein